ncbi:hypothetical protein NMY22_g4800 [Coprinellus aureogranulatus]|nr:hypothetical protein NMY22_g4800 [Coprinellus aureogranulatus]
MCKSEGNRRVFVYEGELKTICWMASSPLSNYLSVFDALPQARTLRHSISSSSRSVLVPPFQAHNRASNAPSRFGDDLQSWIRDLDSRKGVDSFGAHEPLTPSQTSASLHCLHQRVFRVSYSFVPHHEGQVISSLRIAVERSNGGIPNNNRTTDPTLKLRISSFVRGIRVVWKANHYNHEIQILACPDFLLQLETLTPACCTVIASHLDGAFSGCGERSGKTACRRSLCSRLQTSFVFSDSRMAPSGLDRWMSIFKQTVAFSPAGLTQSADPILPRFSSRSKRCSAPEIETWRTMRNSIRNHSLADLTGTFVRVLEVIKKEKACTEASWAFNRDSRVEGQPISSDT